MQKFNHPFGSGGRSVMKEPTPPQGDDLAATDEQDGDKIAEEHGPATEVHMTHDHEMGVHHVNSTHPDGHMHDSDHGSAEEAHEHGKKLAGVGMEEREPKADEQEDNDWGDK